MVRLPISVDVKTASITRPARRVGRQTGVQGQVWRRFVTDGWRGQRLAGCGLGLGSSGVVIEVYGSSGDYLPSEADGCEESSKLFPEVNANRRTPRQDCAATHLLIEAKEAQRARGKECYTVRKGAFMTQSDTKRLLERVIIDAEIQGGRPAIKGTRVPVARIVAALSTGADHQELMEDYGLQADDIRAALAYAAKTVDEIEVHSWPAA